MLPDDELADDWREGGYPYRNLMQRKSYERQKYSLQVELLKMQAWMKDAGQKLVILFEGRDAAGKGGTIKNASWKTSTRAVHVSSRWRSRRSPRPNAYCQWYFQRYVQTLPTAGEIVLFDRSWYNSRRC